MPGSTPPAVRDRLLAVLLRPVLGAVLHRYLLRQARPTHDDRAMVSGPHPIRVLVIGAGLAVGYGASGAAPSLPRQLAVALEAELGRGVIVESRAQASVRLERTIDFIGMVGAATFDVVVWSPTLEETFRGGARRWSRQLREIVEHLRSTGPAHVRVLLMGVPGAEGDHLLQRTGAILAEDVNRRIAAVADRFDRVEHVPVPPKRIDAHDTPLFDPAYQAEVVAALVTLLGQRLRASTVPVRVRRLDHRPVGSWSGMPDHGSEEAEGPGRAPL